MTTLAVALPSDARLGSMTASVAPAAEATPATDGAAEPGGPSLQMTGCTTSDRDVANMMVRLRQMSGVRSVDLASAGEDENGEPIAGAPADCTTSFDVTVTFAPLPGAAAAGVAAAPAPAPAEEDADETAQDGEATPAAPSGDDEEGDK